jgi:uroporphyrinogen-III decarboxylase
MKEMDGEERYLSALRCESVDQMPSHWMAVENAGIFRKELNAMIKRAPLKYLKVCRGKIALANIQARNWLSRGTTSFIPFPAVILKFPKAYYNPETDYFYTKKEAKVLPRKKKKFRISWWGAVTQYGYKLGKRGERLHDYWWYHKPFFSGSEALQRFEDFYREFGAPWEQEFDPNAVTIKLGKMFLAYMHRKRNPYAMCGIVNNHFEAIWGGVGPMTIGNLVRKNPGILRDICQKFEKVSLLTEQGAIEAGFKILATGDDLGQKGRTLISPSVYEEFFYPALKSRCDLAHKHDTVIFMHSCGFIEELLDLMMRAGLDGIQSLEYPAGNDLARIRSKVRDKMCLISGLDTSRILTFGSPDEVEAHVKSQIIKATVLDGDIMEGGYIPGGSHDLLDTPLINIDRAVQSIAKYGKYPLNWIKKI